MKLLFSASLNLYLSQRSIVVPVIVAFLLLLITLLYFTCWLKITISYVVVDIKILYENVLL